MIATIREWCADGAAISVPTLPWRVKAIAYDLAAYSVPPSPGGGGSATPDLIGGSRGGVKATGTELAESVFTPPRLATLVSSG